MNLTTIHPLLTEEEALSLVNSIVKESQSDGIFVSLNSHESALTRFSENQITQNVSKNRFKLSITSYFGKKSASTSTTELEPDAIKQALQLSETLACLAPEDPEWMPLVSNQYYENRKPAFDEKTANFSPLAKGEILQNICQKSSKLGLEASGTLSTNIGIKAIANSAGIEAFNQETEAEFSLTTRIDNGSSWNQQTAWAMDNLPLTEITEKVIEFALASRNPKEIEPKAYTVIFDGAAFASLLPWIVWNLDARAADEGRSFMSSLDEFGKPNGNRLGEQIFSPLVNINRYPAHSLLQSGTFFSDGLSNHYLPIIKAGIPENLSYSRYWATQQKKEPTGSFYPIVMTGSDQSLSDLIAQTEQGILVNRAWYVRYVNPRTLEVTGMTRDGTFYIENGKIAYPIKNLRFNQSLPEMLGNIEALSEIKRYGSFVVPGVKVKDFHFSSITDSV